MVLGIFKTAFLLSDRHIFVRQSKEIWSDFIKLTVKQVFWKTEIESTTMENATFPYKTSLSKANVMTNRMGSIEQNYHKERGFATNCFIFLNINFDMRTSYKQLIWFTNYPNTHINFFHKQEWTNFFLGAQFFEREMLIAHPIEHIKKWVLKTKVNVRSRHN